MGKKVVVLGIAMSVIILALVGIVLYRNSVTKEEVNITGTVIDRDNKFTFNIPTSLKASELDCSPDENCIKQLTIEPKESESDLLAVANIKVVRNYKEVALVGDTMSTKYQDGKWIFNSSYGDEIYSKELQLEPLESDDQKQVITTTTSGSHASWKYIIYKSDYSDSAMIVTIPTHTRIRCDLIESVIDRTDCENSLKALGIEVSPETEETWIQPEQYEALNKEVLSIVDSFEWLK